MAQQNDCIDYVELPVSDIERAKQFFGGVFGWKFNGFGDEYCEFSDGRMKGGFALSDTVTPGGALIVLYHNDLEVAKNKVLAGGGNISKDIFQFPGGERFQFTDPEGHEWAVWRKT